MRQVKFRGKRIDNGEWVEGYYAKWQGDDVIFPLDPMGRTRKVDPSTVGQLRYTNSNGIEYYDGDIYYHAGYGEETVSDLCELQLSLIAGLSDDIGQIIGNIHDKK